MQLFCESFYQFFVVTDDRYLIFGKGNGFGFLRRIHVISK